LQKKINKLQKETGREFNIINLSPNEFAARQKQADQFILNIFKDRTIKIL
jgi:hypothetical protein